MDLYFKLLKYVFAALLLPILATFVYSLCTDPAVLYAVWSFLDARRGTGAGAADRAASRGGRVRALREEPLQAEGPVTRGKT